MHLLYSDESGDDGLPEKPGDPWKGSAYFIRTGIALHDKKWRAIDARVRTFKSTRNIPFNVEIHAVEVNSGYTQKSSKKNGKQVKTKVSNWFGQQYRNPAARWALLEQFLISIMSFGDITIFSTVIDKKKIDLTLSKNNHNRKPKLRSLELLSERFTQHIVRQKDKNCLLIMDSVTLHDDHILRSFQEDLYKESSFIRADNFVETILFCPSSSTHLLQLADVCSYAIWRKFNSSDDRLFKIIEPYFHKNNAGSYARAGLKVWPE